MAVDDESASSDSRCSNVGGRCMNPNSCSGNVKTGLCPGGNDNKCCVPKEKESKCTSVGGQCMNPNNCSGNVKTGLCPGGNDNKCCVPKEKESKCTSVGGQCMNPNSCSGNVKTGLCPGGNDNKCCVPKEKESQCTSVGGQCMNPNSCNGNVKTGLCPGGNDNKCCVPKEKESQCTSVGGQCMNPDNCSGTVKSGLCPGGNDNKCCVPKSNESKCTNAGGQCMNPDSCVGIVKDGLCPGGNDNKCCVTEIVTTKDGANDGIYYDGKTIPDDWKCKQHKVCRWALDMVDDTDWAITAVRQADYNPDVTFYEDEPKCNLFVYEMLLESGIDVGTPNRRNRVVNNDIIGGAAEALGYSVMRPPRAQDWYDYADTINGEKSKIKEYFDMVLDIDDRDRKYNLNGESVSAFVYMFNKTRPGDIVTTGGHIGIISKYDRATTGERDLCINVRDTQIGHTAFSFRATDKPVRVFRLKEKYLKDMLLVGYFE